MQYKKVRNIIADFLYNIFINYFFLFFLFCFLSAFWSFISSDETLQYGQVISLSETVLSFLSSRVPLAAPFLLGQKEGQDPGQVAEPCAEQGALQEDAGTGDET